MDKLDRVVIPLRILLAFTFAVLVLFQVLIVVIGAVLGLLMVVMRALLHQATTLRSDMDAVI